MTQRENEILNKVIEILKNYFIPERIILFGSRAKLIVSKNSDFDLALDLDDKEQINMSKLRIADEEIDKVSGLYKIDLIFLNQVDDLFKDIILKTGRTVYERRS